MPCDSKRSFSVKLEAMNLDRVREIAKTLEWGVIETATTLELWIDVSVKVVLYKGTDRAEVWRSEIVPGQVSDEAYIALVKREYSVTTLQAAAKAKNARVTAPQRVTTTVTENGKQVAKNSIKMQITLGSATGSKLQAGWRK